ncbi:MAG: hypothetical protein FWH24_03740 [Oscillospiraceae bacterium]|nr:hypothetical protein [Oscillospiraceae bacterium]
MRITNNIMMNRYKRNLNINLNRMNDTSNQISTGRRFMKGSEDPVRALKALQVRRHGDALEQYHFNIESAEAWVKDTESAVMALKSSTDRAFDLILQGRNDPLSIEDRQIIATALKSIQDQILKDLNTQLSGKYLLGGANTKVMPFVVDKVTGHLWYNVDPEAIDADTGEVNAIHGVDGWNVFEMEHIDELEEAPIYWDLTGTFQMDELGGDIVNTTALFDIRTTGLDIIGVGPNNLYNLIGRIALAFEMEDMKAIDGPVDVELFIDEIAIGPDGEEFWPFEDFLISMYPDITQPNPDYPHTTYILSDGSIIIGTPDTPPSEYMERIIRPEVPGHRPYLATTMNMFLDEDYLMAFDGAKGLAERLQDIQVNAIIQVTKVGEKSNYLEFLQQRNENSMDQLYEMQYKLEALPPDEAILYFKMHDYVYKATLQMGAYIFQPSLMSFLGR